MIRKLILLSLFFSGVAGCGRLERPEGLPELYPCTIAVTFGGDAIEGVSVRLKPENPDCKWQSGGKTDSKGMAVLSTAVGFDGVPEGKYIVSFTKTEQRGGNTVAEMMPKSLIPLKYSAAKSKEVVEIKPEKNVLSFSLDTGEEVAPARKGSQNRPGPKP